MTRKVPPVERCVAMGDTDDVSITLEQALNAAIITGVSMNLELPPRAASIALATAYQESGIRNLDYGDRDSLGLFQQRPSQGWGTEEQIMDPYYSSNKFYRSLVKVKNWKTGDINDVAQKVQRSGVPDGYRKHVTSAKQLASTLRGFSPASLSCLSLDGAPGDAAKLKLRLAKAVGSHAAILVTGPEILITADSPEVAWASAHLAMAFTSEVGVASIKVGEQMWEASNTELAEWTGKPTPGARQVVVTVRQ